MLIGKYPSRSAIVSIHYANRLVFHSICLAPFQLCFDAHCIYTISLIHFLVIVKSIWLTSSSASTMLFFHYHRFQIECCENWYQTALIIYAESQVWFSNSTRLVSFQLHQIFTEMLNWLVLHLFGSKSASLTNRPVPQLLIITTNLFASNQTPKT